MTRHSLAGSFPLFASAMCCERCGSTYRDYWVPNDMWLAVVVPKWQARALCGDCAGIDEALELVGVKAA
jgi:hypothetical protein